MILLVLLIYMYYSLPLKMTNEVFWPGKKKTIMAIVSLRKKHVGGGSRWINMWSIMETYQHIPENVNSDKNIYEQQ